MTLIRQILLVELLGGIGDVIIALPAIQALSRSHPLAELTVLTFEPGAELLRSDPCVDRVVEAAAGAAWQSVDRLLAEGNFDLIVSDTTYDGISDAIQGYQQAAPFPVLTVTNLWQSPPPDQRVGDRFLALLLAAGVIAPNTIADPELHITVTERAIARAALGASFRPVVFLCPDAGMSIKRWSADQFVTVGRALQQQGATIVVVVGADREPAEQIVQAIGGTAQLWPRGGLRHLAAAIAEADLLIAADTGVARIAAALHVPTITLFGPSWAGRYGQPAPHINMQGYPQCPERNIGNFTEQSCWYSGHCPFAWETCLDDISPDQVLTAATALLTQTAPQNDQRSKQRDAVAHDRHRSAVTVSTVPEQAFVLSSARPLARSTSRSAERPAVESVDRDWRAVRTLLIMRLDNIGDVLMTSPVLRALRASLPDAHITLMTSPAGALTAPVLPWVDEILPHRVLWQDLGQLDFNPDREWQLIDQLKARQFDGAIVLTSFSQSPHPAGLISALAGIPLRLGESKEQDWQTLTHAVAPAADAIHQVDRNLRLIEAIGFPVADRRLCLHIPDDARRAARQLLPTCTYLLLNPWTTCQSRNYHPDRFAAAARRLSEITGYPVAVTGVGKDRERAGSLLDALGDRAIDLVGATTLPQLVALIADAKLVLTNNTSTMHIADATGTPNVVLFAGTEQESQWRPRYSPSRVLRRPTVCSPCYAFRCPYELQCLDIEPETVVAAGLSLLGEGS